MARVLVIGALGQLGSEAGSAFQAAGWEVVGANRGEHPGLVSCDLGDSANLAAVLDAEKPDVVVNTAAFHNVPRCEDDVATAYRLNAEAPHRLALLCAERGVRLIHISTDYVFDGAKHAPYAETDATNPLQHYGATKRAGESLVLARDPSACVVRVSGLYGKNPCRAKGGKNFIEMMIGLSQTKPKLSIVDDEILTPTYCPDVATNLVVLAGSKLRGVIHMTNRGQCSWYEFATHAFKKLGITTPAERVAADFFATPFQRPKYSVLDNMVLRTAGIDCMRPWQAALDDYLEARA